MNELVHHIIVFIAGLSIGLIFFGGLWLTVQKAIRSKIPALWFSISFIVRMGITLLGFFFVTDGKIASLILCTVGFALARLVITLLTKPRKLQPDETVKINEYETES